MSKGLSVVGGDDVRSFWALGIKRNFPFGKCGQNNSISRKFEKGLFLERVRHTAYIYIAADEWNAWQLKDCKNPDIKTFQLAPKQMLFAFEETHVILQVAKKTRSAWLWGSWHQVQPRQVGQVGPLAELPFLGDMFCQFGPAIRQGTLKIPRNDEASVAEIQGQLFFGITMLNMLLVLHDPIGLQNLCKGILDSGILKHFTLPGCRGSLGHWLSGNFIFKGGYLFIETT